MNKRLVASLAATMVLSVASSVFAAANPYVDVPAKHWAYDSVTKLSQAGIVDGYGDSTYKGDKLISRYEMAQLVAKAMTRSDKADAKQKAEIDKLAAEFSEELKTVGVRVDVLEKNQANLKFNGNMLVRYQVKDYPDDDTKTNGAGGIYRLRLEGKATVDKKTTFNFRYVTSDPLKLGSDGFTKYGLPGATGTTTKFGSEGTKASEGNAGFDRYSITSKVGVFTITAGRKALVVGTTKTIVDSSAYSFDGLTVATTLGKVNAVINHGRLVDQKDVDSVELSTEKGKLSYGVGYFRLQDNATDVEAYDGTTSLGKDMLKQLYGNVAYNFTSKFSINAEAGQNKSDYATNGNKFFDVTVVYGDQSLKAKDQSNIALQYWNVGKNALALDSKGQGLTTLDTVSSANGFKGWDLSYNRAFSKNLSSELHYVKVSDKVESVNDYNYIRLNVVAKF